MSQKPIFCRINPIVLESDASTHSHLLAESPLQKNLSASKSKSESSLSTSKNKLSSLKQFSQFNLPSSKEPRGEERCDRIKEKCRKNRRASKKVSWEDPSIEKP